MAEMNELPDNPSIDHIIAARDSMQEIIRELGADLNRAVKAYNFGLPPEKQIQGWQLVGLSGLNRPDGGDTPIVSLLMARGGSK